MVLIWNATWCLLQIGALREENTYPFEENTKNSFAGLETYAEKLEAVLKS
jgi:hypothetical protein